MSKNFGNFILIPSQNILTKLFRTQVSNSSRIFFFKSNVDTIQSKGVLTWYLCAKEWYTAHFKVNLHCSAKIFQKHSHRHTQRCIFRDILDLLPWRSHPESHTWRESRPYWECRNQESLTWPGWREWSRESEWLPRVFYTKGPVSSKTWGTRGEKIQLVVSEQADSLDHYEKEATPFSAISARRTASEFSMRQSTCQGCGNAQNTLLMLRFEMAKAKDSAILLSCCHPFCPSTAPSFLPAL